MANKEPLSDDQKRMVVGCGFSAAIVAAPFIALLYDLSIALVVLLVALALTTSATIQAAREALPEEKRRLHVLLALNVIFLSLSVAALAWSLLAS